MKALKYTLDHPLIFRENKVHLDKVQKPFEPYVKVRTSIRNIKSNCVCDIHLVQSQLFVREIDLSLLNFTIYLLCDSDQESTSLHKPTPPDTPSPGMPRSTPWHRRLHVVPSLCHRLPKLNLKYCTDKLPPQQQIKVALLAGVFRNLLR